MALSNAGMVFSGNSLELPRWAVIPLTGGSSIASNPEPGNNRNAQSNGMDKLSKGFVWLIFLFIVNQSKIIQTSIHILEKIFQIQVEPRNYPGTNVIARRK